MPSAGTQRLVSSISGSPSVLPGLMITSDTLVSMVRDRICPLKQSYVFSFLH
jgi:hypothetical protein